MSVRIWQASDEAAVIQAANDSQPLIAARWPASRGGAAVILPWTPTFFAKQLAYPIRTGRIVDLSGEPEPVGGAACAGFLASNYDGARVTDIDLRVAFVTGGNANQNRTNTALRLRRVMYDALLHLANSVPAPTPIFAEYPEPGSGNPALISTVLSVTDYMEAHNGLARSVVDDMRSWPGLTAQHVITGLVGFVP